MKKKLATRQSRNGDIPTEKLTMKEIEKRYDSQWVVLGEIEDDQQMRTKRARVLWHGASRDEGDRKIREFRPKYGSVEYIGEWPKDLIVIL